MQNHQVQFHQFEPNDNECILGNDSTTEVTDPIPVHKSSGPSSTDVELSDVSDTVNESGKLESSKNQPTEIEDVKDGEHLNANQQQQNDDENNEHDNLPTNDLKNNEIIESPDESQNQQQRTTVEDENVKR